MRIFITGVSCIGKTTIGEKLANLLNSEFFDLDMEIESYFGTSIEKLQSRFLTIYSFRQEASKALISILSKKESSDCVIALPPSGFMGPYWRVVRNSKGIKVALFDSPQNILERITFYDMDSRPIQKRLTEREKLAYLKLIKKDITYFKKSYKRADVVVNIEDCNPDEAALKIKLALESEFQKGNEYTTQ